MNEIKHGFEPVFSGDSKLLILGSFPSVKSRQVDFYYGNRQNRFWGTVCGFFGEEVPDDAEGKRQFLLRRRIALWDVVASCEIEGSSDSAIKNYEVADIGSVLSSAAIELIILNGGTAHKIFCKSYSDCGVPYIKLPSTSPANTRFDKGLWYSALSSVFGQNLRSND